MIKIKPCSAAAGRHLRALWKLYSVLAGAAAGVLTFAVLAGLSVKKWRVG